jgi:hypothetical protein
MDAAKLAASKMEQEAKRLYAECNPQALESEREANAILTEYIAELEQQRDAMEKRALACKAGAENMQQERDQYRAAEEAQIALRQKARECVEHDRRCAEISRSRGRRCRATHQTNETLKTQGNGGG